MPTPAFWCSDVLSLENSICGLSLKKFNNTRHTGLERNELVWQPLSCCQPFGISYPILSWFRTFPLFLPVWKLSSEGSFTSISGNFLGNARQVPVNNSTHVKFRSAKYEMHTKNPKLGQQKLYKPYLLIDQMFTWKNFPYLPYLLTCYRDWALYARAQTPAPSETKAFQETSCLYTQMFSLLNF